MPSPTSVGASYADFATLAADPPAPDSRSVQLYSKDVSGSQHLFAQTSGGVIDLVGSASESSAGKVELATNAETATGTDTGRAVTPASAKYALDSGNWFLQSGTGAVARPYLKKARETWSITDFGASTALADNSIKIQNAVDARSADGGGSLLVPVGVFLTESTVTLPSGLHLIGQGYHSAACEGSVIKFAPASDNLACILVRSPGDSVRNGSIRDLCIYSDDSTRSKIGINVEDVRGYDLDNVTVTGSVTTWGPQMWSGGAFSTGLLTEGREFLRTRNLDIRADAPISIGGNPNLSGTSEITADLFNFHCTSLIAGSSLPGVSIANGSVLTNISFTGHLWIGGGTYGVNWVDDSAEVYSSNLYIENFRTEQGQDANAWSVHIAHSLRPLRGFTLANAYLDGTRKGVAILGPRGSVLGGLQYVPDGATLGLALDATTEGVRISGGRWFSGTTASIVGQTLQESAPTPTGMSSAITSDGYYAPSTSPRTFGTPIAVGSGGTGLSSGTSGGVPYFNAANTMASSAALAASGIVVGGGAGGAPVTRSGATVDASNNINTNGDITWTGASWSSYTPSIDCTTNPGQITAYTINDAKYKQYGKLVVFTVDVTLTTVGTGAGGLVVGLPVAAAGSPVFAGREKNVTGVMLMGYINTSTTIQVRKVDNTTAIADGHRILVSGFYNS